MQNEDSHSFNDLSDGVLYKEPPVGFFLSESQRHEVLHVAKHLQMEPHRPLIVSGPAGFGKTTIVRELVARFRPPNTQIEWVDVAKARSLVESVEATLAALRDQKGETSLLVILDGADTQSSAQLQGILARLFNWKEVRNVIVTTRNTRISVSGTHNRIVGLPDGKLYGLREQLLTPQRTILPVVAPLIVAANDLLIEKLKHRPDDLFKISPRQFEEVVADLLSDMGMEVELTPATRDGGKDILAYMRTEIGKFLCLVEAKQHSRNRPVGVELVRSLYGTLMDHQATTGMLVTTSRFAKPAKAFQEKHKYQLSLKDYGDVVSWILKYKL
jgi:restriction endonuclease Mrr